MRFIALSLTIFLFLSAYSQELVTKKVATANFREIYTVNKITKLESGNYLKLDRLTGDTLISGTYREGVKSGIWQYFSTENNRWMSYNFDSKTFEVLPEEISKIDSFAVREGDSFTYGKVGLPPVYLGSKNEIERIFTAKFKVPMEIIENNKSGISIATFIVDKNGKVNEFHVEQMLSTEVSVQMEKAFKLIDGDWSPATVNSEPVESQVVLVCDINPAGDKFLFPDNPKAIVVHFQYERAPKAKKSIGYRYEIRTGSPGSFNNPRGYVSPRGYTGKVTRFK